MPSERIFHVKWTIVKGEAAQDATHVTIEVDWFNELLVLWLNQPEKSYEVTCPNCAKEVKADTMAEAQSWVCPDCNVSLPSDEAIETDPPKPGDSPD